MSHVTPNDPGLRQVAPVPRERAGGLFPPQYRAAWGPIEAATPAQQARVTENPTVEKGAGGRLGPVLATLGAFRVASRSSVPAPLPGPNITGEQNNPPYWRPSLFAPSIAPGFGDRVRRFSDHPLPVPALQAQASNPVAQRAARLGGRTVARWPNPQTTWPTFGPGGS